MYTVLIETMKNNGESFKSERNYYELFDAQTVAQIEAKSIIAAGGSLNLNWSHSFLYAVNNSEGENVSILVLNERADTQPLRELDLPVSVSVPTGDDNEPCLVCGNCGEAFDTLSDAASHNLTCADHDDSFRLLPRSEAF